MACFWAVVDKRMISDSIPPEERPGLREQGESVLRNMRQAGLHAAQHVETLAALLQEELTEYGRRQSCRVVLLLIGGVVLTCAYLTLCTLAVFLLQPLVASYPLALALVLIFNLVMGLLLLCLSKRFQPRGIAPQTLAELKTDLEWIKLSLKEKE